MPFAAHHAKRNLQGQNTITLQSELFFTALFRRHLACRIVCGGKETGAKEVASEKSVGDETRGEEEKHKGGKSRGKNERKRTSGPAEGRAIVSPSGPQKSVAELEGCLSLIKISHNPFHVRWQSLHPRLSPSSAVVSNPSVSLSHLPACQAEFLIFNYSMPLLISCRLFLFSCFRSRGAENRFYSLSRDVKSPFAFTSELCITARLSLTRRITNRCSLPD